MKQELKTEDIIGYLPYRLELEVNHKVFNTSDTECNCCSKCTNECAMDI